MPDLQIFIGIFTTLFVFLTGIILNYDSIQLGNNQIIIPQKNTEINFKNAIAVLLLMIEKVRSLFL
jgi:hypothetical protein